MKRSKTTKSSFLRALLLLGSFSLISSCSDSDNDVVIPEPPEPPPAPELVSFNGGGVKGPMANAEVNVYMIDPGAEDFKGELVATAATDAQAQIEGLELEEPLSPPYLLEITADDDTVDITTNLPPVITQVSTFLTQQMIDDGISIYATPLTDMTVSLVFKNADSNEAPFTGDNDGTITIDEINAAMSAAQSQVKSTLGFGLDDSIDIFTTPPLIDGSTDSVDAQTSTTAYRSAVEALTAVVYEMQQLSGDGVSTTDSIMDDMAADLSDGEIDGSVDGEETASYPEEALDVLDQDPASLPIPNDPEGRTVSDVKDVVVSETESTGQDDTDTTEFEESEEVIVVKPAETSPDIDGDGVLNSDDDFPESTGADSDNDKDGIPDVSYFVVDGIRTTDIDLENSDNDDDNDGVIDENDDFPFDSSEHLDTDQDGVGNNTDEDDDGDGVADTEDDFPLDSTRSDATDQDSDGWAEGQDTDDNDNTVPGITFVDTDSDGLANEGGLAPDADDDNDGVADVDDAFPLDATESNDQDNDGIGDNTDTDIDGDNVANSDDLFPRDPNESIDTDLDGIGNNTDKDDDGDELTDDQEAILGTNPLDSDSDDDGVLDGSDAFPLNPEERFDSDNDMVGNETDNCPLVFNTGQLNSDDDAFGDACDTDDDNDGVLDTEDDFPLDDTRSEASDADEDGWPAEQDPDDNDATNPGTEFIDTDGDGIGNTTDNDDDGDGYNDDVDQFPLDGTEWLDTDGDTIGDNADPDDDNDQYLDTDEQDAGSDPLNGAETPADQDGDFIPDVNDSDIDGDGVANDDDAFDFDPTETSDTDGDGVGDNSDLFPEDPTEFMDSDEDGVGDNADAFPNDPTETMDSDEDGVGDNADAFPNDPTETMDFDLDLIGDNADNCPMVANPEQEDADGNGVGDVCDQYSFDLTGTWLSTQTALEKSEQCMQPDVENRLIVATQNNEQLHLRDGEDDDGDEDTGITGVIDHAGNITFIEPEEPDGFTADSASYDPVSGILTINFTDEISEICTIVGVITATQFIDTNELVAFTDGVSWFESDTEYDSDNNHEIFFENGLITESGPESRFYFDVENNAWVPVTEDDADDSDYLLTPDGIMLDTDIFEVESFGENGETAVLSTGSVVVENVDFLVTPIENVMLLALLEDEFAGVIAKEATFSSGAMVYMPVVERLNDTFDFWCDDFIGEGLNCQNGVPIYWDETGKAELAQSLDEIVNMPNTSMGELQGGIWIGSQGDYYAEAFLISNDGTINGANLKAKIYKFSHHSGEGDLYQTADVVIDEVGETLAYSFTIPDSLINFFDLYEDEIMPMVFEDTELEEEMIVRRGHKQMAGMADDTGMVFNSIARDDILNTFNWVDTDDDGTPDPLDSDKDGDGVFNEDDAFPLDNSEDTDTDGDGTGDNTDTDIDGDSVLNENDLDPFDNSVSQALTFSDADLIDSYIQIFDSQVSDPNIRFGVGNGTQYLFDDGFMTKSDATGSTMADFNFTDDTLNLYFQQVESFGYYTLEDLVEFGVINQDSADDFAENHGSYQIELQTVMGISRWQRLDSEEGLHRFWQTQEVQYLIVNEWEREQLTGSPNAEPFVTETAGELLALTDLTTLDNLTWTEQELLDSPWALPININFGADSHWQRMQWDTVEFSDSGTAVSDLFDVQMIWDIDANGQLIITIDDAIEVTIQKVEGFETGFSTVIVATDEQSIISTYSLLVPLANDINIEPLLNKFLLGSFSASNPEAFDDEGMLNNESYFGYRLESGGARSTRILSGDFDYQNHRQGWDRWFWMQDDNNDIEINALWHQYMDRYASCYVEHDENCNRWRIRKWRPLQLIGNRLYVIEWEERNNNTWAFPSIEEDLYIAIPPRLNYYEVFDIDTDRDGVLDSIDNDDDNDDVLDMDDEFPFDPSESMDTDQDLIGNNADTDDDNDGVDDKNDTFPLDPTEDTDTDKDGVGDNSDPDIDGDGVSNENDAAPFNDEVGMALSFVSDDLLSDYIEVLTHALDEPAIRLGAINGTQFNFDAQGIATKTNAYGQTMSDYTFENDTLNLFFTTESVSFAQIDTLIEIGMVTPEAAEAFEEANGEGYQVEVIITTGFTQWQRLESTEAEHRFWQTQSTEYSIVADWEREQLTGSSDETPFVVEAEASLIILKDLNTLNHVDWTDAELLDQNWAMSVIMDFDHENTFSRMQSDIVMFNDNGTANSAVLGMSFDWEIDDNGVLLLTDTEGTQITVNKVESFVTGASTIINASTIDNALTALTISVPVNESVDISPIIDQHLQTHIYSTNPNFYDQNGKVIDDGYWGLRLESGGNRVTNTFSGDFDMYNFKEGWHYWSWQQEANNDITLNAVTQFYDDGNWNWYVLCDWTSDESCNQWRKRTWRPLQQVGDLLYVLEWEEQNNFAWDNPKQDPDFYLAIAPRISVYKVLDLDWDRDGVVDSIDTDDDNDSVLDADDDFPFDPYESMDTDQDLIGNNADWDDDNDGVHDEDDAFPLDPTEDTDTDKDGIGDNSDGDIDGDGVANENDIAPYNDNVSTSMTFSSTELLDKYVFISQGALNEPDFMLGSFNGDTAHFDNGMVSISDFESFLTGTYSFANDVLTITFDNPEQEQNGYTVSDLASMGLLDSMVAENFINEYGDNWLDVTIETTSVTWQLLAMDSSMSEFWEVSDSTLQIVDDWHREMLFGSIDAPAVDYESAGDVFSMTHYDSLGNIPWTEQDLTANWALPIAVDYDGDELPLPLNSDLATFLLDNSYTGSSTIFELSYTWMIDNDGLLVITLSTGEVIEIMKEQAFDVGFGAYITYTVGDNTYTTYTLILAQTMIASIDNFTDVYLQHSFSLTNPEAYDENGMLEKDQYFGWRLENADNRVIRIFDGNFNLKEYRDGWDRWFWDFTNEGTVDMVALNHEFDGVYADCDVENDTSCNIWKVRGWLPLHMDGDRLYILEWEEGNNNSWTFPSVEPDWFIRISPRVHFYQKFDIDSDGDGLLDSVDDDDDDDGVSDENDNFPFNHELD